MRYRVGVERPLYGWVDVEIPSDKTTGRSTKAIKRIVNEAARQYVSNHQDEVVWENDDADVRDFEFFSYLPMGD